MKIPVYTNSIHQIDELYTLTYGFNVLPLDYTCSSVVLDVENNSISICGRVVVDYGSYCETYESLCGKIPSYYILRDRESKRFICGFDLLENGGSWVGMGSRITFDSVDKGIEYLVNELGDTFDIFMEEEMLIR